MRTTAAFTVILVWMLSSPATQQAPGLDLCVNTVGMKMVRIEPGSFRMGGRDGETVLTADQWDERPVHGVTITQPFYMATTEVTNAQFEQLDPDHRKWRGLRGVSKTDDEAVTYVSWREAVAFCVWLSEKEGKPYRLPTEAEWEYACRAGTTTPYWTDAELPEPHRRNQWAETASEQINRKDQALRENKGKVDVSLQVGGMPATAWGLPDMHGNVEEWVWDWYEPYPSDEQIDPVGPADGMFKVTRGGSHNTALKYLRTANRSATLPEDKHWLIGFRVVQAPFPETTPRPAVPQTMNDPSADPKPATWNEPTDQPVFHKPVPFVRPDQDHPLLSQLQHHHNPTITWCENGDLLAAWFNTISEIGREMVIVSSRLRYGDGKWSNSWDVERLFFAPADRNTTGGCLLHDGRGRIYYFNTISDSGHHRDQCMMMSISEDSGRTWTRPRIISDHFHGRRHWGPMDSAFVEDDGRTIVLGVDFGPLVPQCRRKANVVGSGVHISHDCGRTWRDRTTGKTTPRVFEGNTDGLAAGFHINVVRLKDDRLLAMGRGQDIGLGSQDIDGHIVQSYSNDDGKTWTYRESPFPGISSGQRLVLTRLNEGSLLMVSFDRGEIYAVLSFDEGVSWPVRKRIDDGRRGYLAAAQTPDNLIHLITSRLYYRFNLAWLKEGG